MTNPEYPINPSDNIDNELAALLNGEGQRVFHGYLVRSLADEKMRILDSLVDHIIAFDSVKIGSFEHFSQLINNMTEAMQKDFESIDGIAMGDDIVASGDTAAVVVDINDPEHEAMLQPIEEGECIRGEIDKIVVIEIPSVEDLHHVVRSHEPIEDTKNNNDFGIAIKLKNAFIENEQLDVEYIPENYIVMIPLNYPTLVLDAVVKTEARF